MACRSPWCAGSATRLTAAASNSVANSLSDNPEAAAAATEDGTANSVTPAVVFPEEKSTGHEAASPQIIGPAGSFGLEQAITLKRGKETGFAVLTKLVEQGPGFELYEFIAVG